MEGSKSISVQSSRRCSRFGARAIRSFCPRAQKPLGATNPSAEVHFYDTDHFALETHAQEIAVEIRDFLGRKLPRQASAA
jgi:hypothetical protein